MLSVKTPLRLSERLKMQTAGKEYYEEQNGKRY